VEPREEEEEEEEEEELPRKLTTHGKCSVLILSFPPNVTTTSPSVTKLKDLKQVGVN
jgi:hypothetical protein